MNSRAKGCRGEIEARDFLRAFGYEAERGQQKAGGPDSQDVKHNVPGVHIEVKRVEAGNPYVWMDQAERDASPADVPVVLHRRNRRPWIAVMFAEDFMAMQRELEELRRQVTPPAALVDLMAMHKRVTSNDAA